MKKWRVSLVCQGIKKRCRNPGRHVFTLGDYPLEVEIPPLIERAKKMRAELMKQVDAATMKMDVIEYSDRVNGLTVMTWQPFSKENKAFPLPL